MSIRSSLTYNFRHGGVRKVAEKATMRLGRLIYRSYRGIVYRCDDLDVNVPEPAGLEARLVSFEELRDLQFYKAVYYPDELRARFERGFKCMAVFSSGELAHVGWLAINALPIDPGIPEIVSPRLAGLYDAFTFPAFRRQGAQTLRVLASCAEANRLGCDRAIVIIVPKNYANRRIYEKNGFEEIGTLDFKRRLWVTSLSRPTV